MRYQKVFVQIWDDEKFSSLSPMGQRFFLYLLTSPTSNLVGVFPLKEGYACEDLKSLPKDFQKSLQECLAKDLIKYDKTTKLVLIRNYLKHNPITNPNQQKAGIKILQSLPKSFLLQELKVLLEGLHEGLTKGLREGLTEGILYTVTDTASVTDTVSVTDNGKKEKIKDCLPEWVPENEWLAYLEMRRILKKPLTTPHAISLALKKLSDLKEQGYYPVEVLNQSVLNSWQGLFPLKAQDETPAQRTERRLKILKGDIKK